VAAGKASRWTTSQGEKPPCRAGKVASSADAGLRRKPTIVFDRIVRVERHIGPAGGKDTEHGCREPCFAREQDGYPARPAVSRCLRRHGDPLDRCP
jgi:hypothetical protein